MSGARSACAAVLTIVAASVLMVEGLAWSKSARFGPLPATTLACSVRLDGLSDANRAGGLREGDVLLLPPMDVASRTAGVFHYSPTQAGTAGETIGVVVQRDGRVLTVPYVLRHGDSAVTFAMQMAFKLVLFGIALLLLWRGADRASMILGLWCIVVALGLPDAWWGNLPLGGRVAGGALTAALWTSAPFLLYLVIEAVATGASRTLRLVCRLAMAALTLPELVVNCVNSTSQALTGCWLVSIDPGLVNAAFTVSQLVIVAFFAVSYARTRGIARQRIRWVFWAFIFSRFGVLLNLVNRLSPHPLQLSGFEWATVLIFPLGSMYAILRHRIIDVNFVLTRTLVYTILTTLVVGIFIVTEDVVGRFAAGRGVGIAVDVAIALLVGFSFNALHRYIEGVIERSVFRSKHEAASGLRRLAEEASFTENAAALLQRCAKDIRHFSGASGTAIYERIAGAYQLTASAGDHVMPQTVDVDDLALVRLRKTRNEVHLSDVASALGSNGLAFGFMIRGQLVGALVCRGRANGESYAPDEIVLLGNVAHEIGAELYAIRARERTELLDRLLGERAGPALGADGP